ncbi:MAG: helix-turn-helix transcriptional regulator [Firmicutes bacterium]|nr:helix-turn-helix transcriptional regulator [Bacillota bacterium]
MRHQLFKARMRSKLTQAEVAKAVGISRSHYTLIENGKRNPSLEVALRIANKVNCDVRHMFGEDKESN